MTSCFIKWSWIILLEPANYFAGTRNHKIWTILLRGDIFLILFCQQSDKIYLVSLCMFDARFRIVRSHFLNTAVFYWRLCPSLNEALMSVDFRLLTCRLGMWKWYSHMRVWVFKRHRTKWLTRAVCSTKLLTSFFFW